MRNARRREGAAEAEKFSEMSLNPKMRLMQQWWSTVLEHGILIRIEPKSGKEAASGLKSL
jgi:hypothetical protein